MVEKSKKIFYENQARSIINRLNARKMEGYYVQTVQDARLKVLELLGDESKKVAYGGSMTIDMGGFKPAIKEAGHTLIDRDGLVSAGKEKEMKAEMINADAFLMSTNAITLDGELVNIDGRGNRTSFLIYGPDTVIIVAGMNKVVKDVDAGIERTRNFSSPANTVRLGVDTPCAKIGQCAHCLENTICCQLVVTRCSRIPGRIKVILVGEELGY